jgi:hypothetical protein
MRHLCPKLMKNGYSKFWRRWIQVYGDLNTTLCHVVNPTKGYKTSMMMMIVILISIP